MAKQPARDVAQRDHAGAGQRGDVDDAARLESLGVGQRIGQNQPAFGIGVQDLDRLAGHRRHDVAGTRRVAAGHVLHGGTMPTTLSGSPRRATVLIAPNTLAAPHMSNFISSMLAPGFSEMPPVSNVTPLPTSTMGLRAGRRPCSA